MNEVQGDDADQHQQRSDRGVDEEFDRCVDASFSAPNSDEKEHRHQRRLEEQVKEQEIKRDEHSDHRRFQQH